MAKYEHREKFIPVSKNSLIQILQDRYQDDEKRAQFIHFVEILEALYHFKFHSILEILKKFYEPFNPDRDVVAYTNLQEDDEEENRRLLIDVLEELLEWGNYVHLNEQDLSDLLSEHSSLGIRIEVDTDQYKHFSVFVRGEGTKSEWKRSWKTLWLTKTRREIPYYKRVVIQLRAIQMEYPPFWKRFLYFLVNSLGFTQFRTLYHRVELPREVTFKIFKDIRKDSLQMLFPYVEMRMTLLDRLRIGVPLVGGVAATLAKFLLAAALSPIALIILLGGFAGYIIKSVLGYQTTKELYIKKVTEGLYYNSLDSNFGVFSYLIDSAEEEELKEALLALHFLWNREKWSLGHVSLSQLDNRVEEFLEEVFGVEVDFDGEGALNKLGYRNRGEDIFQCDDELEAAHNPLKLLVQPPDSNLTLAREAKKGSRELYLRGPEKDPLPLQGAVVFTTGKGEKKNIPFCRRPWEFSIENLHFQGGARVPHPQDSTVLWVPKTPYQTELAEDLLLEDTGVKISPQGVENLPLTGVAEVGQGLRKWKFRYRRDPKSNFLQFRGKVANSYQPQPENPLLIRIKAPRFTLEEKVKKGATFLPTSELVHFPPQGVIALEGKGKNDFYSFLLDYSREGLVLADPLHRDLLPGSIIALSAPAGFLSQNVSARCHSLFLKDASLFQSRGALLVAPGTNRQERIPFRREIFELEFDRPPQKKHSLGATIAIHSPERSLKVKLVHRLDRRQRRLLVNGSLPFPPRGKAIFQPGTKEHEELEFRGHSKLLYLPEATKYKHKKGEKVQEDRLASAILHPIRLSSPTIIVKDSSSFPMSGMATVEQGGEVLEGPFPFQRPHRDNHNTLFLTDRPPRKFTQGTSVSIVGVEAMPEDFTHQEASTIEVDFSQVPDFPEEGKIIIEPASLCKEEFHFRRDPLKIELLEPLPRDYPAHTACRLTHEIFSYLAQPVNIGDEYIELKDTSLFPQEGIIKIGDQEIDYEKRENILFFEEDIEYHHSQGISLRVEGMPDWAYLKEPAKKGERRLSISYMEGVPDQGILYLGKGSQARRYRFRRKGGVLFLNRSLESSFWRKTPVFFPDFRLKKHLSPGENILEVADGEDLPEKGTLVIEPNTLHDPDNWWKELLYRIRPVFIESREEKVTYKKKKDVLWLTPREEEGRGKKQEFPREKWEEGKKIELISLSPDSFGNLDPLPIKEASIWLDSIWDNIFPDSNEFRDKKTEPTRSRRLTLASQRILQRRRRKNEGLSSRRKEKDQKSSSQVEEE